LLCRARARPWRPAGPDAIRPHPAWTDLAAEGRQAAYDLMRRLEPALDADGLSTSARAVLARIRPTR